MSEPNITIFTGDRVVDQSGNATIDFAAKMQRLSGRVTVIYSDGVNVGIGAEPVTYTLEVTGDIATLGGGDVRISSENGTEDAVLYNDTDDLNFEVNGAYAAKIDSDGKLLVGTDTITAASVSGLLQVDSEIMSVGPLAGVFWEDRASVVGATSNWNGWYATGGVVYYYNGAANRASINTSTGAYTALSDENQKRDIAPSTFGLAAINALEPVTYRMLDSDDVQLGFSAQQVGRHIPHALVDTGEFVGLTDRPIIAALVKAVQELTARVEALE